MLPERFDTGRLVLRPIAQADVGAIFEAYAQDPEVAHFLIWRPHRSRDETRAYVASCLAMPPGIERTYVVTGRAEAMSAAPSRCAGGRRTGSIAAMCWRGDGGGRG